MCTTPWRDSRFDYIDLYMLHRDDPGVPVAVVIDVLSEFVRAGQIHAIGASNWSYHRIAEANEYARKAGLASFVVSSPQFSLAVPTDDIWDGCTSISGPAKAAERQWYAQQGMAVISWVESGPGFHGRRGSPRRCRDIRGWTGRRN